MSISTVGAQPYTSLQTGSFSGASGSGSFARVVQQQGDTRTVNSVRTTTTGQSSFNQTSTTRNPDGTISRSATYTNPQGKVSQSNVTLGATQNGTRSITGTVTDAGGTTGQVSGSFTATGSGYNEALAVSDPSGQTATAAVAYTQAGSVDTTSITGTNFLGNAIDSQSISTVLSSLKLGDGTFA